MPFRMLGCVCFLIMEGRGRERLVDAVIFELRPGSSLSHLGGMRKCYEGAFFFRGILVDFQYIFSHFFVEF